MHHVAILNKSWKLIPKILSGEKTIKSLWYQTKRVPWNTVHVGNTVCFRNTGELIVLKVKVSGVMPFEIVSIDDVKKY